MEQNAGERRRKKRKIHEQQHTTTNLFLSSFPSTAVGCTTGGLYFHDGNKMYWYNIPSTVTCPEYMIGLWPARTCNRRVYQVQQHKLVETPSLTVEIQRHQKNERKTQGGDYLRLGVV